MSSPNVPLVNGNLYSFASLELAIAGQRYSGATAVDYDDELKPGVARTNMAEIAGRTLGEHTASGSLEMYKGFWQTVMSALAQQSSDGKTFGNVFFDVMVSYADVNAPTTKDILEACRVVKVTNGHKQGSEPLTVKVELSVQRISHNGSYLAPRPNLAGTQ